MKIQVPLWTLETGETFSFRGEEYVLVRKTKRPKACVIEDLDGRKHNFHPNVFVDVDA